MSVSSFSYSGSSCSASASSCSGSSSVSCSAFTTSRAICSCFSVERFSAASISVSASFCADAFSSLPIYWNLLARDVLWAWSASRFSGVSIRTTIIPERSFSIRSSSSFWTASVSPAACWMIRSFPASISATALIPRLFNFSLLIFATGFLMPSSRWISFKELTAMESPSSSVSASIIRLLVSSMSSRDSSSSSPSSSSSSGAGMLRTWFRRARSRSISACFFARRSSSSRLAASRSSSARRRASSSISSRSFAARIASFWRSISRSSPVWIVFSSSCTSGAAACPPLRTWLKSAMVLVAPMSSSSSTTAVRPSSSESLDISSASFFAWASS